MAKVTVEIEGIDNVSKPFKEGAKAANDFGNAVNTGGQKVADSNKKAGFSFTEFSSAVGLAKQALGYMDMALDATSGKTVAYANDVRSLQQINGQSAESNSRLIQTLDDYKISVDDITTASRKLKDNGLVPNIETVAKLAEQYQAIQDPAKKAEFAQKNLGRSTKAWLEVLNQSPAVLKEQAAGIAENLILTQKQVDAARKLELAEDAKNDALQGVATTLGNKVIPIQTDFLNGVNVTIRAIEIMKEKHIGFAEASDLAGQEIWQAQEAMVAQKDAAEQLTQTTEDLTKADQELQKSNADLIAGARATLDANNDYAQSQSEITAQIADLTAQKQTLISQGWWAESDAVKDVQSKIDELNGKYTENKDKHAEMAKQKLLDMSLEAIALSDGIAGFSAAEAERAQVLLQTADAGAAAAFKEQQAFVTASQAIAAGTLDAKELDATLKMMAKGYTIEVAMQIISHSISGANVGHEQGQGGLQGGFADGGISTGPASGHTELLHGTEAVIPLKGGSIPVQVQGVGNSNSIDVTGIINELRANRMDENRLARAIVSAMKRTE